MTTNDAIRCRKIILEDRNGNTGLLMDVADNGVVVLKLFGKDLASLTLIIDSDGLPKVSLNKQDGTESISVGYSEGYGAGITLHDEEGKPRFTIRSPHDNKEGSIEICDEQGRSVWKTDT